MTLVIDALEAERISHVQTRRALAQATARLAESTMAVVLANIRERLGIVGDFQVMNNGAIVLAAPQPPDATPAEAVPWPQGGEWPADVAPPAEERKAAE